MCSECRQTPCSPRCPNNDDKPVAYCDNCGIDIYANDGMYIAGKKHYCLQCVTKVEEGDGYAEF